MHAALDDPKVHKVVGLKSAQVAWTDGVLLNYLGKRIDLEPCPMVGMFPRERDFKEFNDEKFVPMVEVTSRLASKIPIHKKRDKENRNEFKNFPGGFLKFVHSNSPSSVKSTPAEVVFVEEPDDSNENVKGQGDTITLLEERCKTFARAKIIFGGTPTIKGISRIEAAYLASDQRKFFVPCDCGQSHVLAWENVHWHTDPEGPAHEVFGHERPETAYYACPHCGLIWSDRDKNRFVKRGEWRATAPFYGTAGFYINELYSPFPGSTLAKLAEKYLAAKAALAQGDDTKMRSFVNNTEGRAYEYQSGLPDTEVLAARPTDYEEFQIPWGGMILTAGVDVQHDRLAVVIRAWGRSEESWLIYWGELYGSTMILEAKNPETGAMELQGAWADLEPLLTRPFIHASGAPLRIRAVSIDSSDGQTSDAVYGYVRRRMARGYMAAKGDSHDTEGKREIFSVPKAAVDTDKRNTKAHKWGVRPFIVGTARAKDLILGADEKAGRIKLQGHGPGRMHVYRGVRSDYWDQLTAEVKAPGRDRRVKVWQKKSGARNEALDCEVYALHAARSLKLHLWREDRWTAEEMKLRQADLLASTEATELAPLTPLPVPVPDEENVPRGTSTGAEPETPKQQTKRPAKRGPSSARRPGGFSATDW